MERGKKSLYAKIIFNQRPEEGLGLDGRGVERTAFLREEQLMQKWRGRNELGSLGTGTGQWGWGAVLEGEAERMPERQQGPHVTTVAAAASIVEVPKRF